MSDQRMGQASPQGTKRAEERPATTAPTDAGSVDPSRAVADQPAGRPELPESKSAAFSPAPKGRIAHVHSVIGDCDRCGHSVIYHLPLAGCMKCDCDEFSCRPHGTGKGGAGG